MSTEPDPCLNEFSDANVCLQVNGPANCDCYDDINAFPTSFPQVMQMSFSSAQAFAFPSDPFFCDTANERVCDDFKRDFACCCQDEVEAYRKCLFNKVFVPAVPDIQGTCEDSCSWKATDEGGDDEGNIEGGSGGTTAVAVCFILFFLAMCGAVFWFIRRRKKGQAHRGDGASDNIFERIKSLRSYIPNFTKGEKPEDDNGADQDIESASLSTSSSNSGHDKDHKDSKRPSKAAQEDDPDDRKSMSKKDRIRQKRDAIEHWVSDNKRGSKQSLEDYLVVELEENPELAERKQKKDKSKSKSKEKSRKSSSNKEKSKQRDSDSRACRNSDGRGYSSQSPGYEERQSMKAHLDRLRQQKQKLKERVDRKKVEAKLLTGMKDETSVHRRNILLRDTEKMNTELGDLETTKAYYEGRLRAAKDESIMLKEEQNGALHRIARLEEQNKALVATLQQQGDSGQGASIPHRSGRERAALERSRSRNRLDGAERSRSGTRLDGRERSRSRQPLDREEDVSSGCEADASRTKTKPRNSARSLQRSGSNRSLRSLRNDRGLSKQDSFRDVRYNSSYSKVSDLVERDAFLQVHDIYHNY